MEELIPITMFMCIAAVMILRPITRRIGGLLEVMTRDRVQSRTDDASAARTIALMEHVNRRLDLIEERLDFTERLLSARTPDARRQVQRSPLATADLEAEYLRS